MSIHSIECNVGTSPIIIETGKMARLADGAVTVRSGDTIVLVTVVSATKIKEGQTFFPLSVEYKEKAAAAGMFPGGYFKREGRPTEKEILTCRMTDRPLRPMFPKGYFYDTQVISLLLSADGENEPDILSINGASAACVISDLPTFRLPNLSELCALVESMVNSSSTPATASAKKAILTLSSLVRRIR